MKYIFFLGRLPAISLAEIQAMLEKYKVQYKILLQGHDFIIIDSEQELRIRDLFVQMGGTLKIAEVIGSAEEAAMREQLVREINQAYTDKPGKKSIGYSIYSTKKEPKDKEALRQALYRDIFSKIKRDELGDKSVRIVYPDADKNELSTATIFNNRLAGKKNMEIDIIYSGKKIIIGRTVIVQDIESYSLRDYEKPGRDAKIGMMPPKLAQVMINLAHLKEGQLVFDPFCGTGTILQEALLDDFRAVGSDANGEQIQRCKQNLKWISEKYVLTYPDCKVFQASFNEAIKKLKPGSVDAIVTESTLGPVYKKTPSIQEIKDNYNTLKKLYTRFLQNVQPILKSRARIVVTLPAYQLKPKEYVFAEFVDSLEKLGYSKVCPLDKRFESEDARITKRNTIIYSRPEQVVAREIVIFQSNK